MGELNTLRAALSPVSLWPGRGHCLPSELGFSKVLGTLGTQGYSGPRLVFQLFSIPPVLPRRGPSPLPPRPFPVLPLRARASSSLITPVPFSCPLTSQPPRLQDSGLLKTEKSTSQHVFYSSFADTALCHSPSSPHPSSTHFSSLSLPAAWPLVGLSRSPPVL